jgi:uncharacterized RDD family membrane protein YckC
MLLFLAGISASAQENTGTASTPERSVEMKAIAEKAHANVPQHAAPAWLYDRRIQLAITLLLAAIPWFYYKKPMPLTYLKYATFWPRFWTTHVDDMVLWPLTAMLGWLAKVGDSVPAHIAVLTLELIICWGYTIGMQGRYGQTLGKMACQVKIVDAATEGPITYRQALVREIFTMLYGLALLAGQIFQVIYGPPAILESGSAEQTFYFWYLKGTITVALVVGIDIVVMFFNPRRRMLHDYIAGTVVVRVDGAERFEALSAGGGELNLEGQGSTSEALL